MNLRRISVALTSIVAALGCERAGPEDLTPAPEPASSSAPIAVAAPAQGPSAYDLSVPLTDQDGRSLTLDAFGGHPVIISMFYTRCGYTCPTLVSDIQRFERSLAPELREQVRVLLVSFDAENDTPERLKTLAGERKLDERRWRLARASEGKVRELAAVLGLKYRKLEDGSINHSSSIILLDRDGRVAERIDGLARPVDALVTRTTELLTAR